MSKKEMVGEKKMVESKSMKKTKKDDPVKFWRTTAFVLLGIVILTQLFDISIKPRFNLFGLSAKEEKTEKNSEGVLGEAEMSELQNTVLPAEGVELPISWGDLGEKMVSDGVIDESKFLELFTEGLTEEETQMLSGKVDSKIVMTQQNSRFILDMLWAFGLANRNEILSDGEMTSDDYGGAGNFASTGGWSLSVGEAMNHYSAHPYVILTKEQQEMVDRVSLGIFRPCCGNSTHFPDCNHGMAMLGLLELMAANNVGEKEMYDTALKVNSLWFPQTYIDLAVYFKEQGQEWSDVDSKLVLSAEFSSGQGYAATRQKIKSLPAPEEGGGGCSV